MARTIDGFRNGYNTRVSIYAPNLYDMKETYNNEQLITKDKLEFIYVKDYKSPYYSQKNENNRKSNKIEIQVVSKDRLKSDDFKLYKDAIMTYSGIKYRIISIQPNDTNKQKGFRTLRNSTELIFTMVR